MKDNKTALVLGAGGFIGSHLVNDLKRQGFWVRGVDLVKPEFTASGADEFVIADLSTEAGMAMANDRVFTQVYQLAADMGGAGYIFSGDNDAQVMRNSSLINLMFLRSTDKYKPEKVLYSSSACVYPEHNQLNTHSPTTSENSVYPANPDSDYGWEKLYAERLFQAHARNFSLDIRIARFHNIFGPLGAWDNGKEKVPAAICRKVAQAHDNGQVEVWGDGEQTRSFLFIDDCLQALSRLMDSSCQAPVNIGSDEMISINQLAEKVIAISGKSLTLTHIEGPQGVRGRSSDNTMIKEVLAWSPNGKLEDGLEITYQWVHEMVQSAQADSVT